MRNRRLDRSRHKITAEQKEEITKFRREVAQHQKKAPERLSEHLQAFNDAVIAIIMTIIVLEIKPPLHEVHYEEFLADIFIFLIAFLIIADFWYDLHTAFSQLIFRPDKKVAILDIFLLADLSLLPVMTKWIMGEASGFAVMNFGIIFFVAQVLKILIQYFGSKDATKDSKIMEIFITRGSIWKVISVLVLNLVLIGLAFYIPKLAMLLYIIIPIISFFFTPSNRKIN